MPPYISSQPLHWSPLRSANELFIGTMPGGKYQNTRRDPTFFTFFILLGKEKSADASQALMAPFLS